MKMVKSLLLGSAAGLVAVAGAQAADLPVKAKAVEYVKVCSLYGAGFYYIPGTDTCIKIGGFVRTEWLHNASGSFAPHLAGGAVTSSTGGLDGYRNRGQRTLINRSRGIVTFDTRSQTEYGTLRSYMRAGWQWSTDDATVGGSAGTVYVDRFFVQFAGFTFGKTQSFFDPGFNAGGISLQTQLLNGDTGGSGTPVAAYTWQLGNGVTATLSLEDHSERRTPVVEVDAAAANAAVIGVSNVSDHQGNNVPDIVGNLRVDQAWGSAQISGALHNVSGGYYGANVTTLHPDDRWGWAVGGGLLLKMPWDPKDTLRVEANYGKGATRYVLNPSGGATGGGLMAALADGNNLAVAWADDGYFWGANAGVRDGLHLPTAWNISGGFNHYWTPTLQQSIYASYTEYEAPGMVDTRVCNVTANSGGAGCFDWSAWQVGSRLLWNPVTNLDIGLDVMYSEVDGARCAQAAAAAGLQCGTAVAVPATAATSLMNLTGESGIWSAIFRVQRNFWP